MRASNAPKAGTPSYYPLGTLEACAGGVAAVRRSRGRGVRHLPQVERATGLLRQYVCSTMVGSGAGVQGQGQRAWGRVGNWAHWAGVESLLCASQRAAGFLVRVRHPPEPLIWHYCSSCSSYGPIFG